jgi:hypothetical protein
MGDGFVLVEGVGAVGDGGGGGGAGGGGAVPDVVVGVGLAEGGNGVVESGFFGGSGDLCPATITNSLDDN